jgi:hypothetical protein
MNDTIKTAAADQEFESAFFQLAYDKLQSKLFNLLPYLVGFETVTKSDDNAKAVGVFGFKSQNDQVLLVPVFFINGKVKEPELLYSKNNNQYYPLNEDFANMFLQDDVTGLGRVSNEKRQALEQSLGGVDYRDLVFPPRTGRISYASVIDYIKEEDNNVKQAAWDCMAENPDFLESMLRFYSEGEIASALVPKVAAEKVAKVTVVSPKDGNKIPAEKKLEVAKKGYGIVDNRLDVEKSKWGPFQYPTKFASPSESGFYSYLTHCGTLRYGLILLKPFKLTSQLGTEDAYVIDLSADNLGYTYQTPANSIFIREQVKVEDFSQIYKMMQDPAEGNPDFNKKYILINEKLKCSEAFTIIQNFKDQHGLRRLVVRREHDLCNYSDYHDDKNNQDLKTSKPCVTRFYKEPSYDTVTVVFTKLEGESADFKGPIVYLPKGFKLLQVSTNIWVDEKINWSEDSEETREKKRQKAEEREAKLKEGKPGGLYCLTASLREQHIFPMSVRTNGSEFFAKIKDVTKKYDNALAAKIGMVIDFGLDEKVGEELIDSVKIDQTLNGELKLAYTGDYYPQMVEEAGQAGELGIPTTYGIPHFNVAPTSGNTYTGDPTRRNMAAKDEAGSQGGPGSAIQQAIGMAQAGQKQIFDTQSIAALAKYINPSDKVISYIPDFVGTVDKLGRILFMVHWDIDKFQKMYGYDELPELIELVKNVFKNLGDLIIFLKRKFPDISINSNESMPDKL